MLSLIFFVFLGNEEPEKELKMTTRYDTVVSLEVTKEGNEKY